MSKVLSSSLILVIKEHKLEPIVTGLYSDRLNTKYGVENGREKRTPQTNKWRCHRQAEDVSCAAYLVTQCLLIKLISFPLILKLLYSAYTDSSTYTQ
jgi:hypothetical protein